MKNTKFLTYFDARLHTLQQRQKNLELQCAQLWQNLSHTNEQSLWNSFMQLSFSLWECRGMQKAYHEMRAQLSAAPPEESAGLVIEQRSQDATLVDSTTSCPECSGTLTMTTSLEPAAQPGYIVVSTHFDCPGCGYHDSEQISLPKEIALQQYNLEQLIEGV